MTERAARSARHASDFSAATDKTSETGQANKRDNCPKSDNEAMPSTFRKSCSHLVVYKKRKGVGNQYPLIPVL